jgi:hypothetical protein
MSTSKIVSAGFTCIRETSVICLQDFAAAEWQYNTFMSVGLAVAV